MGERQPIEIDAGQPSALALPSVQWVVDFSLWHILLGAFGLVVVAMAFLLQDPQYAQLFRPEKRRATQAPSTAPTKPAASPQRSLADVYDDLRQVSSTKTAYRRAVQGGLKSEQKTAPASATPRPSDVSKLPPLRARSRARRK